MGRNPRPAKPEVSGSLRDGTDRALSEAGGDPTARGPPVSSHYSHTTPHCGRTRTLLTAVCLWQGATAATADGVNYVDGRQADLTHMHRRGGRGGEYWQLPACAARASQAARIAHQLSRRRAGRHSVRTGRLGGKGQRSMQCTVAG